MDIPVYKIDSDVPVPKASTALKVREVVPLDKLSVGESIEFELKLRANVASLASRATSTEGKKFTIKKVSDSTVRIWRIA